MSNPLRIAVIIKNFVSTGGAERYAVETARRMKDRGHDVHLYARTVDDRLAEGMTLFRVPERMMFSSVLALYSFSRGVSRKMAGKAYDVIHTHDKGCRGQVSTVHTFSFKRGMSDMSLLKRMNEFCISPRAWLYLYMERLQARSDCLVGVSEVIRADIRTCHGRDQGIRVIPPGVDVDRFSPEKRSALRDGARREYGLQSHDTAVLFVGSEFRRKGLDNLIPAITGQRLFVVGRQERMDHYRSLAAEYGLKDRVVFTGLTGNVMKYYALADILILPSVAEAFGMTVLEGMACGLPVITSVAAGCSCVVENGKNGFAFDDPQQISGLLTRLGNKEMRTRMGAAARKTAQTLTWDDTARLYEQLYYEVAAGGRS